ncbi:MAG TPA: hypothetical protein VFP61_11555 [Acidimicrobiales bacterium]|nr:hypothetical protein [Acidimicrobiales bacterium]
MQGRVYTVGGVVAGVAIALGSVPYLAGAAHTLASAAESLVGAGGQRLLAAAASSGAPATVVQVATAAVAVVLPGCTALLAVLAARGTLQLRAVVALALAALGAASFAYQAHGHAAGALVLALAVGGLAVAATGPLVVFPLCALAGLLGGETLPSLLSTGAGSLAAGPAGLVHAALYGTPGSPLWLRIALLVLGAVPFAAAARVVLGR